MSGYTVMSIRYKWFCLVRVILARSMLVGRVELQGRVVLVTDAN